MLTRDRIGALFMLAFSIGYGVMIFRIPLLSFQAQAAFTARTMPQALSLLGIALALVLLFKPESGETAVKVAGLKWKTAAALCALMVFYGFTIRSLGFLISTNVFLIGSFLILGERRAWIILVASVPIVVFFWVLMTQFLGVYIAPWPEFLTG
jgi:putative tricarboxylic transport membrane protein